MQEQHLTPKTNGSRPNGAQEAKQRRRMWLAILLLLTAVVVIVVKDWHVWFPPADGSATEAGLAEPPQTTSETPAKPASPEAPPAAPAEPAKHAKPATHAKVASRPKVEKKSLIPAAEASVPKSPVVAEKSAGAPALALQIVTGDAFQKLYPGNEGLRVEIQSGAAGFPKAPARSALNAGPLSPAAERAPISADITRVPTSPAASYPTLAQKMKVQGSVVLQAVIGSDGLIEDLRILSGPALLASAAREAVRQWHFKPYLQNGQPVETLAKITVNFIISTS